VVDGLRKLGAFGIKIPKKYEGLGFSQQEYQNAMELVGSFCGNLTALLSAHQSIGVPQPVKMFGTEEQKQNYLPRCAKGAISAFALTETGVGSDPARLSTTAELSEDGTEWILNGEKLWCTNVLLAEVLVVMARNPTTHKISCFIVEMDTPGVRIEHRCHFMGLKALANGVVSFSQVRIPRENLVGGEGKGLKIALVTLNTGRLTIPSGVTGGAKIGLELCRKWSNARQQWGHPIGKHEAIGHLLADMAADTFAMETIAELTAEMADRGGYDIRLEAAAAKEWNTTACWNLVDDVMQIRSGRGYETEWSLEARGEAGVGVERMMRDSRINRIFEGSSEIMHLFMAREAVDKHLHVAGDMIDPKKGMGAKLAALPSIGAFYAWWYPTRWLGWAQWPKYSEFGRLAGHLRFVDRGSRKLARQIFHGMMRFQAKMQRKQAFLFRCVDIAMELFAIAAVCARAQALHEAGDPSAKRAMVLADLFAKNSKRKTKQLFRDLWSNDDAFKYSVGQQVLKGEMEWLEEGSIGLGLSVEDLTPVSVEDKMAAGEIGGTVPIKAEQDEVKAEEAKPEPVKV